MFDYDRVLRLSRELLEAIGENPDREGLQDTPRRYANWWREFIEYDPGTIATSFRSSASDQMIVVSGIKIFSLCEHHLLPFWCDIAIGYIPNGKILGLSKFGRIAHAVAHRLQLQEQITSQIANWVQDLCDTQDVAVVSKGQHTCMIMRGIKTPSIMSSSVMYGAFRDEPSARQEFFYLMNEKGL